MSETINLDDQMKLAQINKLKRETAAIPESGWSFDVFVKLIIAACAIVGGVTAVMLEIPKQLLAKVEAEKALVKSGEAFVRQGEEQKAQIKKWDQELQEKTDLLEISRQRVQENQELLRSLASQVAIAAQPLQLKDALKPRVFVQFAGAVNRKVIDELRSAIAREGFITPGAERINRDQNNEVRYFIDDAAERQKAELVFASTQKYFLKIDCPIPELKIKLMKLPSGKASPIEVWLNHSCVQK